MTRYEELWEKIEKAENKGQLRKIETEAIVAKAVSRDITQDELQELYDEIQRRLHLPK